MKRYYTKEQYFNGETLALFAEKMVKKLAKGSNKLLVDSNKKTALIVCDIQKFFFEQSSNAYIPSAKYVLPNILKLIDVMYSAGQPVIFTRHGNNISDAGMMVKKWKKLIERDSVYFEIIDELDTGGHIILDKIRYDAFYQTNLDKILNKNGMAQLIVTGVMTHLCCETTVRSAFMKDYNVLFPVDATATYNEEFHTASYTNLCHGFIEPVTTNQLIETLKNG